MFTTLTDPTPSPPPTTNSSPSTSIQEPVKFSAEERMWLAQLPDELLDRMTRVEAAMLTRLDEKDWPPELRQKVEPYIDLDEIE